MADTLPVQGPIETIGTFNSEFKPVGWVFGECSSPAYFKHPTKPEMDMYYGWTVRQLRLRYDMDVVYQGEGEPVKKEKKPK